MKNSLYILIAFLLFSCTSPAQSAIRTGIEYQIPIEYKGINESDFAQKANTYFSLIDFTKRGEIDENITDALNLYNILRNKNPDMIIYPIRLGIIYDHINKDRLAKSCYYMAIGLEKTYPEPYFRLGEFYYTRNQYIQALKFYTIAYKYGYSKHYETLYKLGDIYQKFGDNDSAIKFLNLADNLKSSPELEEKINSLLNENKNKTDYYRNPNTKINNDKRFEN